MAILLNMGLPEHKLAHCSSEVDVGWVSTGTVGVLVGSAVCSHRQCRRVKLNFGSRHSPSLGMDRQTGFCAMWDPARSSQRQPELDSRSSTAISIAPTAFC